MVFGLCDDFLKFTFHFEYGGLDYVEGRKYIKVVEGKVSQSVWDNP